MRHFQSRERGEKSDESRRDSIHDKGRFFPLTVQFVPYAGVKRRRGDVEVERSLALVVVSFVLSCPMFLSVQYMTGSTVDSSSPQSTYLLVALLRCALCKQGSIRTEVSFRPEPPLRGGDLGLVTE
jgi:hypothetical protein